MRLRPLAAALLLASCAPERSRQEDAAALEVRIGAAVERACAYLKTDPGFEIWPLDDAWMESPYRTGSRALSLLALLQAGEDPRDPAFQRMLGKLEPHALDAPPVRNTYTESVLILLRCRLDPKRYQAEIADSAAWLQKARMGGERAGQFHYVIDGSYPYTDNSVSHFALLALSTASRKAGVRVPRELWEESLDFLLATQQPDGGWTQGGMKKGKSYGTMTAVGLESLLLCLAELGEREDEAVQRGLDWLGRRFSVDRVPQIESSGAVLNDTDWQYDWYYALQKLETLTGNPRVGPHLWREEAARKLLELQAPDGHWEGTYAEVPPIATAFAVLALTGSPVVRTGAVPAPSNAGWEGPLERLPKGERIFRRACSACHGMEDVRVGPSLREIAGLYRGDPEGMARWIRNPGRKRPGYPAMPAVRLADEASYLEVARFVLEAGGR